MTRRNALAALIILLTVSVGFADVQVFRLGNQIAVNQASDTHALCTYRNDLHNRLQTGTAYLVAHPKGIAGISPATIQLSLTAEQHTLNALSSLKC